MDRSILGRIRRKKVWSLVVRSVASKGKGPTAQGSDELEPLICTRNIFPLPRSHHAAVREVQYDGNKEYR